MLQKGFKDLKPIPCLELRQQGWWKKSFTDYLKLNVNGAMFIDYCKADIGMVLRDEHNKFWFVASMEKHEVSDLEDIKLLEILRGLHISTSMSIKRILVENDCLLMVKECNTSGRSSSRLDHLVIEIKRLQE